MTPNIFHIINYLNPTNISKICSTIKNAQIAKAK